MTDNQNRYFANYISRGIVQMISAEREHSEAMAKVIEMRSPEAKRAAAELEELKAKVKELSTIVKDEDSANADALEIDERILKSDYSKLARAKAGKAVGEMLRFNDEPTGDDTPILTDGTQTLVWERTRTDGYEVFNGVTFIQWFMERDLLRLLGGVTIVVKFNGEKTSPADANGFLNFLAAYDNDKNWHLESMGVRHRPIVFQKMYYLRDYDPMTDSHLSAEENPLAEVKALIENQD